MSDEAHYRMLEQRYSSAPTNEYYQPQMRVFEGGTEIIIPVKEDFFHGFGAVHGSVYFKALDDAAYFAAQSKVKDYFLVTTAFHIQFLRPISSGEMRAEGKLVYSTRRHFVADAWLYDSKGREIGRGSGSFAKSNSGFAEAK